MKEQIKEIARVLCKHYNTAECEGCNQFGKCMVRLDAEWIYDAGYRKQSEGKWIWINQATGYLEPPFGDTCKCSLCEFEIDVSETHYKFCPNCGAKMKGVTDDTT
jgi:hypothetical protein